MSIKKKIMITLLTSSKINFLEESYKSVINQRNVNTLDWDIYIIVNTLNDEYYYSVLDKFKNANIIRTESNGKPGKGHNSVLRFFGSKTDYDYLFMVDGDDFLYPSALQHIEAYINNLQPEILGLMYHDTLSYNLRSSSNPHLIMQNACYFLYNFTQICNKYWIKAKSLNPFQHNINEMNTMLRLILFSRESLKYNIKYDENCSLYDDFYPAIQVLELAQSNKKVFRTSDTKIYLYNSLNDTSASRSYKKKELENTIFQESIKNKFQTIRNWDILKITYKTISNDFSFTLKDKYLFISNLIKNLKINNSVKFIEEPPKKYFRFVNLINNNESLIKEYQFAVSYYNNLIENSTIKEKKH